MDPLSVVDSLPRSTSPAPALPLPTPTRGADESSMPMRDALAQASLTFDSRRCDSRDGMALSTSMVLDGALQDGLGGPLQTGVGALQDGPGGPLQTGVPGPAQYHPPPSAPRRSARIASLPPGLDGGFQAPGRQWSVVAGQLAVALSPSSPSQPPALSTGSRFFSLAGGESVTAGAGVAAGVMAAGSAGTVTLGIDATHAAALHTVMFDAVVPDAAAPLTTVTGDTAVLGTGRLRISRRMDSHSG